MATTRFKLHNVSKSKPPVLDFHEATQQWRVWTAYDPGLNYGTYYTLGSNGIFAVFTVKPDGTEILGFNNIPSGVA